jgi:hypothetical protein
LRAESSKLGLAMKKLHLSCGRQRKSWLRQELWRLVEPAKRRLRFDILID